MGSRAALYTASVLRRGWHLNYASRNSIAAVKFYGQHHQCRQLTNSTSSGRSADPSSDDGATKSTKDATHSKRKGFLSRLLAPDSSGESPVLRLLGYYTVESKAIGAANSLYDQILTRSRSALTSEFDDAQRKKFVPQYEMMAIHIYLTLRRLRYEKGLSHESQVKIAMQSLFDIFWTDVRNRMMINEHALTILESSKWIKQCERNFLAMAHTFDESWEDDSKMMEAILEHVTSLEKNSHQARRLRKYMMRERLRLEKVTVEQMWEGISWDPNYPTKPN